MNNNSCSFKFLDWDSNKLNIPVYQVDLSDNIDEDIWNTLLNELQNAKLIYIKNPTRNFENSKIIARFTSATHIDTNITLHTQINKSALLKKENFESIEIKFLKEFNWDISSLLDFKESRFIKDDRLFNQGGKDVFIEWIENSKGKNNKTFIFALEYNTPQGFILYSTKGSTITIELISVSKQNRGKRIGSSMMQQLMRSAFEQGFRNVYVGTQIENTTAINFYIKNGFFIESSTDIYHWWK